jgi:hypothetical protein
VKWKFGQLCLDWFESLEMNKGPLGMVWSTKPVYLAATVSHIDKEGYTISEQGLRGLSDAERESLKAYLAERNPDKERYA